MAGYKANIGPKGEEAGKTGQENATRPQKSKGDLPNYPFHL